MLSLFWQKRRLLGRGQWARLVRDCAAVPEAATKPVRSKAWKPSVPFPRVTGTKKGSSPSMKWKRAGERRGVWVEAGARFQSPVTRSAHSRGQCANAPGVGGRESRAAAEGAPLDASPGHTPPLRRPSASLRLCVREYSPPLPPNSRATALATLFFAPFGPKKHPLVPLQRLPPPPSGNGIVRQPPFHPFFACTWESPYPHTLHTLSTPASSLPCPPAPPTASSDPRRRRIPGHSRISAFELPSQFALQHTFHIRTSDFGLLPSPQLAPKQPHSTPSPRPANHPAAAPRK
jgi:hypothetical protein